MNSFVLQPGFKLEKPPPFSVIVEPLTVPFTLVDEQSFQANVSATEIPVTVPDTRPSPGEIVGGNEIVQLPATMFPAWLRTTLAGIGGIAMFAVNRAVPVQVPEIATGADGPEELLEQPKPTTEMNTAANIGTV